MLELALHVGIDGAQRGHSEVMPNALLLTHSKSEHNCRIIRGWTCSHSRAYYLPHVR